MSWLMQEYPKHYCGVFGVYGHPNAAELTYYGLYALQHRGQESAGIVASDGKEFHTHKGMGLVSQIFRGDVLQELAGNMAIGIHTARQDSVPVLAIVGQVATDARYREAFQEAELSDVFTPVAKWAVEPPSAERLGELTLRAATALVRRLERRLGCRVAEARVAPLRAVDTTTLTIPAAPPATGRLRLIAAGVATPGGAGAWAGVPLWLDRPLPPAWAGSAPPAAARAARIPTAAVEAGHAGATLGPDAERTAGPPTVAMVPADFGYARAAERLRALLSSGVPVGAVLAGRTFQAVSWSQPVRRPRSRWSGRLVGGPPGQRPGHADVPGEGGGERAVRRHLPAASPPVLQRPALRRAPSRPPSGRGADPHRAAG